MVTLMMNSEEMPSLFTGKLYKYELCIFCGKGVFKKEMVHVMRRKEL